MLCFTIRPFIAPSFWPLYVLGDGRVLPSIPLPVDGFDRSKASIVLIVLFLYCALSSSRSPTAKLILMFAQCRIPNSADNSMITRCNLSGLLMVQISLLACVFVHSSIKELTSFTCALICLLLFQNSTFMIVRLIQNQIQHHNTFVVS